MSVQSVALGEVAEFIRGVTYKPNDLVPTFSSGSIVCMRTANIQSELDDSNLRSIPRGFVKDEAKILREGDLLVSTANSWNLVGKCCWVPSLDYEATVGGFIAALRGNRRKIDQRYLYHWFSSSKTQAEARNCGRQTTNISNMDLRRCLALRIPLPTLPEQRRIAAILDKADALRSKRRDAIAKLDQLLQSVFLDMFGDPVSNSFAWQIDAIGTHASKIGSGATPRGGQSVYKEEGISLIRSMNVRDGGFLRKDLARIDGEQAGKLKNVAVEANDVLLNITGASVARVCRAPMDVLPARVNQHVAIIRCEQTLSPVYLERLLLNMKKLLLGVAGGGATREAITKQQIESFQIPVPPVELQRRFTQIAERIDAQAHIQKWNEEVWGELLSSLQHRAFSGTL